MHVSVSASRRRNYEWLLSTVIVYLKGFAPMPPAPCFLWNGGYEAKWLRKSGSLAWLGAWATLGKTKKGSKISSRSDQSLGPGGMKAKLENEVNMDLKSLKISPREPQHETNMDPKCTPKGALEASKRGGT